MSMIKSSVEKIVLFNGPPGSGKDLAATMMQSYLRKCGVTAVQQMKFASPIKEATHFLLGIPYSCEHYEANDPQWKNQPQPEFFGTIPREAYIAMSEDFAKWRFGQDVFGKIMRRRLERETQSKIILVSDSGFADEAKPLIARFGAKNCLLIEMHREGTSFEKDSRSYIYDELKKLDMCRDLQRRTVLNDMDKDFLRLVLTGIVQQWFGVSD